MFDTHKSHPLLAQVPLTVSPFLSIPSAVTLPYTFRSVQVSLPPSVVETHEGATAKYVKSSSGHAAHPNDIITACEKLKEHTENTRKSDAALIQKWEDEIKEKDLAEKRRVAPGWLDREEKILEPTRASAKKSQQDDLLAGQSSDVSTQAMSPSREGEELDRVFGTLGFK